MKEYISETIKQLRKLLLNKKVIAIDSSYAEGGIAKITTEDGNVFVICGNDLGDWIETTVKDGNYYPNLQLLFKEVHDYDYYNQMANNQLPYNIIILNDELIIESQCDKKQFKSLIPNLSKWEQMICRYEKAKEILSEAPLMGEFWKMILPKELLEKE